MPQMFFMECLYIPKYNQNEEFFKVPIDEANHLKALRLKLYDKIMISNGVGNLFITQINQISGKDYFLSCLESKSYDNQKSVDLAIGLLKHRDRFEFAIEKATELGVDSIIPLRSDFSEKSIINRERLESKAVAALKQSKNPFLPKIFDIHTLENIDFSKYKSIVLADIKGKIFSELKLEPPVLILVGPEGGFSNDEINKIEKMNYFHKLFLGNNRLRTETAAIISINMVKNIVYYL
jgi:16S rRNA (uracil1498-N3)-methyltransferase